MKKKIQGLLVIQRMSIELEIIEWKKMNPGKNYWEGKKVVLLGDSF